MQKGSKFKLKNGVVLKNILTVQLFNQM